MEKRKLTLATRNRHKVEELASALGEDFEVYPMPEDTPPVEETGTTFLENATLKAAAVSRHVSGWVLADDSGLEVDALGGAPGVISAHYAGRHGDDAANNAKVLAKLAATGDPDRRARFRCVLVLAQGGTSLASCEGSCEGRLLHGPEGSGGFGYDPLFVPDGETHSFGTLPASTKAKLSHRAMAMVQLKTWVVKANK
jgi:XTP/dITP diphosphohydrolase